MIEPASRIVSLAPYLTELLFSIDAGAQIVGTAEYSDYPQAARAIPRIGRSDRIDIEAVMALAPDLVLAWSTGNPDAQVAQLERLGLRIFRSRARTLTDIATSLRRLGALTGHELQSQRKAQDYEAGIATLTAHYTARPVISVFYQIWDRPLYTVTGDHWIDHMIRICGGRNIFHELKFLAPSVGLESVLAADPEVIVASGADSRPPPWLSDWNHWPQLRAVRTGNLYAIDPDLLQRPSLRLLDGARQLCETLDAARTKIFNQK